MKEYQTFRVSPDKEAFMLQKMETFGWKAEDTREVYNESQEVVGETYKANNSFMRGFTGNDGNVTVHTRTNVTHYLSMRFSRETTMPNYTRLKALQDEFEGLAFEFPKDMPTAPVLLTIVAILGLPTIILPIIAIVSWVRYPKKKQKVIEYNEEVDRINARIAERSGQILEEAKKLVSQSNVG